MKLARISNPAVPVVSSCYRIQAPPDTSGICQVFTTRRALSVQLLLPLHCVEARTVQRTHSPSLEAVVATAKRMELLEMLQGLYSCVPGIAELCNLSWEGYTEWTLLDILILESLGWLSVLPQWLTWFGPLKLTVSSLTGSYCWISLALWTARRGKLVSSLKRSSWKSP